MTVTKRGGETFAGNIARRRSPFRRIRSGAQALVKPALSGVTHAAAEPASPAGGRAGTGAHYVGAASTGVTRRAVTRLRILRSTSKRKP